MLNLNQKFPNFCLPNQDGKNISLADYSGKWLILYVYPKDDTPGCTIQGKSFTQSKVEFGKNNISIAGISADDVGSHKNFCNKYQLTIDLLADPEAKLLKAAKVSQIDYQGTLYWERTTFLIDPEGILRKIYIKVKPEGHEQIVLNDIKALQNAI